MRYLCLAYADEKKWDALSESDRDAFISECLSYDEDLRKSGQVTAIGALQPTQMATTVRLRSGRACTTEGPYAGTREQLAGFFLINARDLNEAIQVVAKSATAHLGAHLGGDVEIRPILEVKQP